MPVRKASDTERFTLLICPNNVVHYVVVCCTKCYFRWSHKRVVDVSIVRVVWHVSSRCLYLALFRHITALGQRGCNKTALEFCKLLLRYVLWHCMCLFCNSLFEYVISKFLLSSLFWTRADFFLTPFGFCIINLSEDIILLYNNTEINGDKKDYFYLFLAKYYVSVIYFLNLGLSFNILIN